MPDASPVPPEGLTDEELAAVRHDIDTEAFWTDLQHGRLLATIDAEKRNSANLARLLVEVSDEFASLTAQVEQLRTERDEIVRNVREELVDLGYCSYMAHNGDMGEVDPECPGTFCHFTTLLANYEQGSPDE